MCNTTKYKRGWDKSPSLSIVFGLSSKTQWLSGLYYADFISFYSPTQLCGGGTTKSNSNELTISVPLSKSLSIFRDRRLILLGLLVLCLLAGCACVRVWLLLKQAKSLASYTYKGLVLFLYFFLGGLSLV